ncbi:UNVERIFIED_CONTAM: hypothetical protein FKN15_058417 [Acipenser sinensis]
MGGCREKEKQYMALIERDGISNSAPAGPVMTVPKAQVQNMTVEDDPETYLVASECLATTTSWPQEFWASQLGSRLNE